MLYLTLITADMSRTLKYLKHAICRYRSVKKGPSDVILLNYFDLAIEAIFAQNASLIFITFSKESRKFKQKVLLDKDFV